MKKQIKCSVCRKPKAKRSRKPWWVICPCSDKLGIYAFKHWDKLNEIGGYKYEAVHDGCLMKRIQSAVDAIRAAILKLKAEVGR